MKKNLKEINILLNVLGLFAFIVSFGGALFAFGFDYIKSLLSNNGFLNINVTMPASVSVWSFVFLAVLIAMVVLGQIFKNKVLLLTAAAYQVLLLLSVLMLLLLMNADVSEALYTVLLWVLIILFAPVYGAIWQLGAFFFLVFIPLIIVNIVFVVKLFKSDKKRK